MVIPNRQIWILQKSLIGLILDFILIWAHKFIKCPLHMLCTCIHPAPIQDVDKKTRVPLLWPFEKSQLHPIIDPTHCRMTFALTTPGLREYTCIHFQWVIEWSPWWLQLAQNLRFLPFIFEIQFYLLYNTPKQTF